MHALMLWYTNTMHATIPPPPFRTHSMNDRMAVAEAHKGDEELRAILQEARAVGMDAGSDGGQVQMTYVLHGAALADT